MNPILISVAITVVALVPLFVLGAVLLLWKHLERNRKRRSPLTSDLLRPPGYSLSEKLESLSMDLGVYLFGAIVIPLFLLASFFAQQSLMGPDAPRPSMLIYAVALVLGLVFLAFRIVRIASQLSCYRDGLAGERATAQLLEPVTMGGGRVFHDILADGFNIDHVVVAPGGVYAIETKHRLKPTVGRALDNAKVSFDGKVLRFPDWVDTTTADQAVTQARWLSERLSRSTGLAVKARPVIALPGWWVDVIQPGEVWAMNPKNCSFMFKPSRGEPPLTGEMIQRIAFQVEQLCRLPDPSKPKGK